MSQEEDRLLSPAEAAAYWQVDPRTLTRWAKAGKVPFIWTPGGHRRYRQSEMEALFKAGTTTARPRFQAVYPAAL